MLDAAYGSSSSAASNYDPAQAGSACAVCPKPPADPDAPGMHEGDVEHGPNDFRLGIEGPDPQLAVGGSHDEQETQRDDLLALSTRALVSYTTGHTPLTPRWPSDSDVSSLLSQLNRNPPIGNDGQEVTHAVYQSQIPNATPQQAYDHFVNDPQEVFSAGGMEIRPPADKLEDGGRYMLEIGGPVPTWLPVEIGLDPQNHAVTINTLDGHVLRGEQTFTFTDDCHGGTTLTQDARFQASTKLVGDVQQLASVAAGQHQAWQHAHREIYGQFNGDANYAGMGTDAFNEQQLSAWGEALGNIVKHPGTAADVLIDSGGEIANETIDQWGGWAGDAMNWAGVPGGGIVRKGADLVGDGVSVMADVGGDMVKRGIDFITPW